MYTGHGFAGIITEKDDVNVYQMYPKKSTSAKETHATLVSSKDKFSNFRLVVDVRTDQQLRQNSEPNKWEVASISSATLTHFTIIGSRSSLMVLNWARRIATTVLIQPRDRLFYIPHPTHTEDWPMVTMDNRSLDNQIMISIDGNKIINFKDKNISKELSNGEIAMYTEDAKVSFDNFYLSQLK